MTDEVSYLLDLIVSTLVQKLKSILSNPAYGGQVLRLSVSSGGCSGFQYKFELDQHINSDEDL